jgi:hypothetical protein
VSEREQRWVLRADQWSQTYYELRDGKLYFCENDNKEQQYGEREQDIPAVLREYASTTTRPYPEMIAFLRAIAEAK